MGHDNTLRKMKQANLRAILFLFTLGLWSLAKAEIFTGDCGTTGSNVTYQINDETGELIIEGTGAMRNFSSGSGPFIEIRYGGSEVDIRTVIVREGVTIIGDYAFYGYQNLTSVSLPASLKAIGKYSFSGCSSLEELDIPSGVTVISNAFEDCPNLKKFNFSSWESFLNIEFYYTEKHRLFINNEETTDVVIPENITEIRPYAFAGADQITSIKLPENLRSIGSGAFYGCSSLTSINIPENLSFMGDDPFAGCTALHDPMYSKSTFYFMPTSYSGAYSIPEGISSITGGAFQDCEGLLSVEFPESLEEIGGYAFAGSGIKNIRLPQSVKHISSYAFYNCISLEDVDLSDFQGTIDYCAFNRCTSIRNFILSDDNPNCYLYGTGLYTSDHLMVSHFTPEGGKLVIPYPVKDYCYQMLDRKNILQDCAPLSSVEFPCSWVPFGGFPSDWVPNADVWIFRSLNFPIYGECAPDIYVFECDSAHVAESTRNSKVHVLHLPESEMMVEEYMRNKALYDDFAISLNSPGNNVEGYFFGMENCQPSSIYPNYFPSSISSLSEDGLFHLTQFYAPLIEDIEKGNIPPIANSVACANGKAFELESRAKDFAHWFLGTDTIYGNEVNKNYGTYSETFEFDVYGNKIWSSNVEENKCDASCGVPNNTYWLLEQLYAENPKLMYFLHMVPNMPYRIHALFAPVTETEQPYKCKVQFILNTNENPETEELTVRESEVLDFEANQYMDVVVFDSVYTNSNLSNSIIIQGLPKPAEIRKGYSRNIPFVGFWVEPLEEYDLNTGVKTTWQAPYAKDDVIYNLSGQRISTPQKGIYIQNGRKMLKK